MNKCSEHPDSPHGFNRSASHAEGRYVCDCEVWIPDEEDMTMSDFTQQQVIDYLMGESGTFSERKSFRMAAKLIEEQQAEIDALKEELNSVTEYKDKLTAAVHVLLDQLKRGEVTLGVMYDVDVLL